MDSVLTNFQIDVVRSLTLDLLLGRFVRVLILRYSSSLFGLVLHILPRSASGLSASQYSVEALESAIFDKGQPVRGLFIR